MITKIDLPKMEGAKIYDNKGGCGMLVNYLTANNDKLDGDDFFTLSEDNLPKIEAEKLIDNNVKGLRRTETKFISLTINPSHEEVKHIGGDKSKMKTYVRACMANYAETFRDKNIKPTDLVWTAIIHEHRYFTNKDKSDFEKVNKESGFRFQYRTKEEVESFKSKNPGKECDFEKDARKPGHNMHAHIIVSKRDSKMKVTLTPHGKKGSFKITDFQKSNQDTFQAAFNYKRGSNLYNEMQIENISRIISDINDRNTCFIDKDLVLKLSERGEGLGKTCSNLKQLNMDLYRAKQIDDPYKYLEIGKGPYWKSQTVTDNIKPLSVKLDNNDYEYGLFTHLIKEIDNINKEFNDNSQSLKEDLKRKRKRKNNI